MNLRQPQTLSSFLPKCAQFIGVDSADIEAQKAVKVCGITTDSRAVVADDLFVARTGRVSRGSDYIQKAAENGAGAVLTNDSLVSTNSLNIPVAYMEDLDGQLSAIAGQFFGFPSQRLGITGITGTNGKTSCCYWYSWLSNELGRACGQVGTLGAGFQSRNAQIDGLSGITSTGFTTPDAVTTQRLLAEIEHAGAEAVAMEVSSHALDQGRVKGIRFQTAIFTNLSQDHLDYHHDMQSYLQAKSRLFQQEDLLFAILNLDDATYSVLKEALPSKTTTYSYSISSTDADIYLKDVAWVKDGAQISFSGALGEGSSFVPVVGEYNLANLLAVIAALVAEGVSLAETVELLPHLPPVPGRLEWIFEPGLPAVVVDYAHTPDAVAKALTALRPSCAGRLVAVVGCGGDRDTEKRPLMAKSATNLADSCWFTSDNPRSEDQLAIIEDMSKGVSQQDSSKVSIEPDRKVAIQRALSDAQEGDLIVILGKGHENYQEINGQRHPHNDVAIARQTHEALRATADGRQA